GEKNPLSCQIIPVFSTVLALLGDLDVLTIPTFQKIEQLFAIMRIAGDRHNNECSYPSYPMIIHWAQGSRFVSP
ncbi:MAG: hypothetical protein SFY66_12120, partial [Oculatellaceae cyanobacterium bins.114]|nr:hypothetical protein [Oculatellaceae cyanobacterium bins.114]